MFTEKEIKDFQEELPSNGTLLLRQRTKISRLTIQKFIEGKKVRVDLAEKIWIEGWNIIKESKEKKADLKRHAEQVINKTYK